jgi:hypothetical protein
MLARVDDAVTRGPRLSRLIDVEQPQQRSLEGLGRILADAFDERG